MTIRPISRGVHTVYYRVHCNLSTTVVVRVISSAVSSIYTEKINEHGIATVLSAGTDQVGEDHVCHLWQMSGIGMETP